MRIRTNDLRFMKRSLQPFEISFGDDYFLLSREPSLFFFFFFVSNVILKAYLIFLKKITKMGWPWPTPVCEYVRL
jgi:hypothetical protein